MAELSERDIGILQNEIDSMNDEIKTLQDGIESDYREINNLLLKDIATKKFVDEKHLIIYELEEERRLLTGKTIIGPVEEDAFSIATNESNVKAYITDGRFVCKKNNIAIVDVPLLDSRAYILSSSCGPNFDIWTRDRHGSASSMFNVSNSYTIHEGNNKITVIIDGEQKTIEIISADILETAVGGELVLDASGLASNLSISLDENFSGTQCFYHTVNKGFTIASGSVGPTSTVQVLVGLDSDDIARLMKFQTQVNIPGRYANNKFKIAIDKEEQELEITFDVRIPVTSSLGMAMDDYSADWKTDFSAGPTFPAESNNGKKIATLLQTKLRETTTGGYKNAEAIYYSSSSKFIIYSGTFGETSSITFQSHSDTNRDLLPFIGLVEPTDNKNNEIAYTTLQTLYNYLNSKTALVCTNLNNATFKCYSLLMIENGVLLSQVPYILQTTSEYDDASVGKPRLYSGKLVVDSTNDKFDLQSGTITITHGEYSEGELCGVLQLAISGSTITYQQSTKRFVITMPSSTTFLFNSGANKSKSIATYIGFPNTADQTNTTFTSGPVSFSGVDFFSMAEIPQFVLKSYFGNQPPYYYDTTLKSERGLINAELLLLNTEDNSGTGLINNIKTQTDVYSESNIIALENAQVVELSFVNSLMLALQSEISNYSVISTTDSIYINLITALNNAIIARDNLIANTPSHDYLINLRSGSDSFTYNSDFTEGGIETLNVSFANPNGDRIYNLTPIEFKYADTKLVLMKNVGQIYSNNVSFDLFIQEAFSIQSNVTAISGYSKSNIDANGLFTISSVNNKLNVSIDGVAKIIILNSGTNLTGSVVASDIQSKLRAIATGGFTNARCFWNRFDCANSFKIFSGTTGVTSTVTITDDVVEITTSNNKIDFQDSHTQVTAAVIAVGNGSTATYSGTLNARVRPSSITFSTIVGALPITVTDDGNGHLVGNVGVGTNTVNYLTGAYNVTFSGNVDLGANVTVTYQYYTVKTATIVSGVYDGSTLATAVAAAMNAVSTNYSCIYSSITNHITISSTNTYFNLIFASGPNIATSAASTLGYTIVDKTGSLSYESNNVVVLSATIELNWSTEIVDTGHTLINMQITITDAYISSVAYWSGGNSEHLRYTFTTYNNIKSLVDVIDSEFSSDYAVNIGKATIWSRKPEKYQINHNEQFQIRVNNGSIQSTTFNLTQGQLVGVNGRTQANEDDTLILSLNGETAKTITFPVSTGTGIETATMIQSLVRSLIATNPENQLAYSNFTCTFSANSYTLKNGTYGSGSSIQVSGGTLAPMLNLSGSNTGTGQVANNYAVTITQLISAISITGATISNEDSFLKIQANNPDEKLEIISNSLSNRLGFYAENLTSDPKVEFADVNCKSIINVTSQTIHLVTYIFEKGFENRGNITAIFSITDNVRLNARLPQVTSRQSYLATRQSQITSRLSTINSALSPTLYNERWTEVVKRLNKKTGSYFKVGEKYLGIIRSESTIAEKQIKINEMKAMLGV